MATREHDAINARMLAETAVVAAALFSVQLLALHPETVGLSSAPAGALRWGAAILQGFWLQRLYVVGHESAHRNLFPGRDRRWLNDLFGQIALTPLLVPLNVFRAIHKFHHGANRRDPRSAALDVYVVPPGAGPVRRAVPWVLWYLGVFAGGWFLHSLVSVVLFLFLPPSVARRVSPAFHRWTLADQLRAQALFAVGLALHLVVAGLGGGRVWVWTLGVPFLVFAWVYSVQLYCYHFRTTMGPAVRFHARRVRASRLTAWWLLDLPEHATHHRSPAIPWHQLRAHRAPQPPEHADNERGETWIGAVAQQAWGPTIVEAP